MRRNVASKLGAPASARIAILYVDDVGMCQCCVPRAVRKGVVTPGSISLGEVQP